MSYALTGAGAFFLFIVLMVTLSPNTSNSADPQFVTAAYLVSGAVFVAGIVLYILQNRRRW